MPRRKYGHMVGVCPPTPVEKCRACRLGLPCPVHKFVQKPDFKEVQRKKRRRHTGKK